MPSVNELGLRSGPTPNVYIRGITLSYGPIPTSRQSNSVDRTRRAQAIRSAGGDLLFRTAARRSIEEYSAASPPLKVDLKIQLQDILNTTNQTTGWLDSAVRRGSIKLKIIQSTNSDLTNELMNGEYFDIRGSRIPNDYNKFTDYQIQQMLINIENHEIDAISSETNSSTGNIIKGLIKDAMFLLPGDPQHLTYFVFTEFDDGQDEQDNSINLHSPVAIEKVIDNSEVQQTTSVFVDSNNRIWPGPVHLHPQDGWMVGAFHVDTPHESLTRNTMRNFKLKDLRILSEVDDLAFDVSPCREGLSSTQSTVPKCAQSQNEQNYLSDLYISRDAPGNASGIFNFDYLGFLKKNSKFGGLLVNATPRVRRQILNNTRILSLRIARDRVRVSKGLNRLGGVADITFDFDKQDLPVIIAETAEQEGVLVPLARYTAGTEFGNKLVDVSIDEPAQPGYEEFGSISELNIDNVGAGIRTFSFVDNSISRITDGKYQYEARIRIQDGSYIFLERKLADLKDVIFAMKSYLGRATQPSSFDEKTGEFSRRFIEAQSNPRRFMIIDPNRQSEIEQIVDSGTDLRPVQAWLGGIVKYIEMLDILTDINEAQKSSLSRALYGLISPITGSPDGITKFIELLQTLQFKFSNILLKNKTMHSQSKSAATQAHVNQFLSFNGRFSQVFDSDVAKHTGFRYIDVERPGVLAVTSDEIRNRFSLEVSRYDQNIYNQSDLDSSFDYISSPLGAALFSRNADFSFLAPAKIEIDGNSVNLLSDNKNDLDYIATTAVIKNVINSPAVRSVIVPPGSILSRALRGLGQGASRERLNDINEVHVKNAVDSGIIIQSRRTTANLADSNETQVTATSNNVMGPDNLFTSDVTPLVEDLTSPEVPEVFEDVIALVNNILHESNSLLSDSPFDDTNVADLSFDLNKENNFINKAIRSSANAGDVETQNSLTIQRIEDLPTQIKLLALNKSRIYTDAAASLSTADDAQTDAYMYNFGMLRVVEYLAGYRAVTIQSIPGAPASRNVSIKVPVWLKLNSEVIGSIRSGLLCRIRKYNDPTANIGSYEMFDSLPVIGEHFLLTVTPGAPVRSARVTRNSSATLNAESLTYPSAPFLRSAERENFLNLLRLESDRTILEERVEYTLSEPPQPATNTRGQTSSVPGAREVRRIVPPPRQSRTASAAPIMTSPVGVAQGNTGRRDY